MYGSMNLLESEATRALTTICVRCESLLVMVQVMNDRLDQIIGHKRRKGKQKKGSNLNDKRKLGAQLPASQSIRDKMA